MWIAAIIQAVQEGFKAFTQIKNNADERKEITRQAQANADERMRNAKKQMQEQKTSFLKGGVGFDSGSANSIINETYDTAKKDVNDIQRDSKTKQRGLRFGNIMTILSGTADTGKSAYEAYNSSKSNYSTNSGSSYTVGTSASNKSLKNKSSGWSDRNTFGSTTTA